MGEATTDRRGALKGIAALFGAAAAALASVPVLGSALTPLLRRRAAKAEGGGTLAAVKLDALQVGVPRRVELVSTVRDGWTTATGVLGAVWVLKHADGRVTALSSVCPHSGCSIKLEAGGAQYACPCHDSAFGLDGVQRYGPSPRAMDPLEVQVEDGQVRVRWARFKVGVKERTEI